ncbi:adenylyl-sulfate kinase [Bacteroidia bacterium]|nr:adenylyl-sulfate kinase [Bacteroidia bacterium]
MPLTRNQKPETHIVPQSYSITLQDRIQKQKHAPKVFWMTGLSGSGKSTIANALQNELFQKGYQVYVLDGDNVRGGLNKDLDFSDEGRIENIRRISEVAKLFSDAGFIVIAAFISPFRSDRQQAREIIGDDTFCEVFVDTPLEVCEQRDVKGLYKKARAGEIKNFTGIGSAFEKPEKPEVQVKTQEMEVTDCVKLLEGLLASSN